MSIVPFDREFPPHNQTHAASSSVTRGKPLNVGTSYPAGVPRRLSYPTYPACGLLEQAAAIVPNRTATEMSGVQLTYAEVQSAAVRLASWLQQSGLASGDRVAVLLPNMPEYMIALNGIWRAGGVAVALSPLSVAEEVASMLKATDCRLVIGLDVFRCRRGEATEIKQTILGSLR